MKRTLISAVAIATLVASVAACTPRDIQSYTCLNSGAPIYDVPTDHGTQSFPAVALNLANGTTIDAQGESFVNDTRESANRTRVISRC